MGAGDPIRSLPKALFCIESALGHGLPGHLSGFECGGRRGEGEKWVLRGWIGYR